MINSIGSNISSKTGVQTTFGKKPQDNTDYSKHDYLMVKEHTQKPLTTDLKIITDKLGNATTTYPLKGLKGSKNANFYEFLTMGTVPYLVGSGMLMAVFNLAGKFFDPKSQAASAKLGRKMSLGVLFYGVAKSLSKKLIEIPVKERYGIDVNLPYRKVIYELPEANNKEDLISYEYHKAFESVDFPRWDLLYGNEFYGDNTNSYYDKVAKKMGLGTNLPDSDQKVKPLIKEVLVKTKTFSTLSSYLWAAVGVGIAMQKPWENFKPRHSQGLVNTIKNTFKSFSKTAEKSGKTRSMIADFFPTFGKSFKEFLGIGQNSLKTKHIAGRVLFGLAAATTLIGNIVTLTNAKKHKSDKLAATSIIDDHKEKVVC